MYTFYKAFSISSNIICRHLRKLEDEMHKTFQQFKILVINEKHIFGQYVFVNMPFLNKRDRFFLGDIMLFYCIFGRGGGGVQYIHQK